MGLTIPQKSVMMYVGYRLLAREALRCGCFPHCSHWESIFSLSEAFPDVSNRGEVIELYMTWEVFFLFCTVVIDLLALVVIIYQNNKKK
jgi:hypothetical protein